MWSSWKEKRHKVFSKAGQQTQDMQWWSKAVAVSAAHPRYKSLSLSLVIAAPLCSCSQTSLMKSLREMMTSKSRKTKCRKFILEHAKKEEGESWFELHNALALYSVTRNHHSPEKTATMRENSHNSTFNWSCGARQRRRVGVVVSLRRAMRAPSTDKVGPGICPL